MSLDHSTTFGHTRIGHLEMRGIVKRFPGVLAADRIDFDVRAGEIHALLGENGAGKSTLMKMLYGLYQPDGGEILLDGKAAQIRSPRDAIAQGIGMVHQHFMLVPSLTVAENVALGLKSAGTWRLDLKSVSKRLRDLSEQYHLKVEPDIPVWQLAVGEQQRVEILRALYKGAALLILDEPTAVLTPGEADDLFGVLKRMTAEGIASIFISHKLHEVLAITDRVTVLRDGRQVGSIATSDATRAGLAEMMVGRPVVLEYERPLAVTGDEVLRVTDIKALNERGEAGLRGVSFSVHGGEIVGVAGVSGNGQTELAQAIMGLRATQGGSIHVKNTNVTGKPPAKIHDMGVAYVPEERMVDGAIKDFSCAENYVLHDHSGEPYARRGLFLNFRAIAQATRNAIGSFEIKTPSADTPIKNLSGGNIQKLILARELARKPALLIAAQPTRSVDIGASEYIHKRLLDERARGAAVLLISEDLDEVLALSDRIAVMYEGRIIGIVGRGEATVREIGAMMAGTRLHESVSP